MHTQKKTSSLKTVASLERRMMVDETDRRGQAHISAVKLGCNGVNVVFIERVGR